MPGAHRGHQPGLPRTHPPPVLARPCAPRSEACARGSGCRFRGASAVWSRPPLRCPAVTRTAVVRSASCSDLPPGGWRRVRASQMRCRRTSAPSGTALASPTWR
eukprot:scaffold2090_cov225-Prasinococcus_capsulatus_cf.AAC.38